MGGGDPEAQLFGSTRDALGVYREVSGPGAAAGHAEGAEAWRTAFRRSRSRPEFGLEFSRDKRTSRPTPRAGATARDQKHHVAKDEVIADLTRVDSLANSEVAERGDRGRAGARGRGPPLVGDSWRARPGALELNDAVRAPPKHLQAASGSAPAAGREREVVARAHAERAEARHAVEQRDAVL
jgi:hypothetical protein